MIRGISLFSLRSKVGLCLACSWHTVHSAGPLIPQRGTRVGVGSPYCGHWPAFLYISGTCAVPSAFDVLWNRSLPSWCQALIRVKLLRDEGLLFRLFSCCFERFFPMEDVHILAPKVHTASCLLSVFFLSKSPPSSGTRNEAVSMFPRPSLPA